MVLTASDDTTLRLYSTANGDLLRAPDGGNERPVTSVAFSPDGSTYVHGCADGSVLLRNTQTGSIIREFVGHALAANAVDFSPDGTRVVSGSDDATAIVFDAGTGGVVQVLDGYRPDGSFVGHTYAITSVAFSSNSGNLVVTGSVDQTAKLWRVQDGAVLRSFEGGHTNAVTSVKFSPTDEFVLTGSDDATARLWNTLGGRAVRCGPSAGTTTA